MSCYLSPAQIDAKNGDAARTTSGRSTRKRTAVYRFVRHLVEMIVAMMIGMAALGALWRALLSVWVTDLSAFRLDHAALVALVMAFDMTVPMVWWMRHRGHNWARGTEMAGAMFVPTLLLIGLLHLGAISADSLIGLAHALMLPSMLLVMFWRLDAYTAPHMTAPRRSRNWFTKRVVRAAARGRRTAERGSDALDEVGRLASEAHEPKRATAIAER